MKLKLEPVKWMTVALGVLTGLAGVTAVTDLLPKSVVGGMAIAIAVLTALLGAVTRDAVTPLARPRSEDGTPLVPDPRYSPDRAP
jgi:hypothetical protein